jgi:hypothetical protein
LVSYVNIDSLRQLLISYNPSEALFFGEELNAERVYMCGGGGYVLSRAALDKFIKIQDDPRTDEEVGCDRRSSLEGEDPAMGRKKVVKFFKSPLKFNELLQVFV